MGKESKDFFFQNVTNCDTFLVGAQVLNFFMIHFLYGVGMEVVHTSTEKQTLEITTKLPHFFLPFTDTQFD